MTKNHTFLVLIMFLISAIGNSQSKIEKAEKSLIEKEAENSTIRSNSNPRDSNNNANSENGFFAEVLSGLFVQVFAYTIYGIAIESPFETQYRASNAYLNKFPYFNSKKGNYTYEWNEDTPIFRSLLSLKYISENSRIKGSHLNIDTHFLKRFGLEADYLQLWENNPHFGTDNLAIYTLLAKYHRVRTEKFNAYWGLGTSYIDGEVNQFGFTYGLGAEWFISKPISLEANFNQTLINEKNVNKFNALINYHLKQYKFNGGYEHLKIGNQNFSNISLGMGVFF